MIIAIVCLIVGKHIHKKKSRGKDYAGAAATAFCIIPLLYIIIAAAQTADQS